MADQIERDVLITKRYNPLYIDKNWGYNRVMYRKAIKFDLEAEPIKFDLGPEPIVNGHINNKYDHSMKEYRFWCEYCFTRNKWVIGNTFYLLDKAGKQSLHNENTTWETAKEAIKFYNKWKTKLNKWIDLKSNIAEELQLKQEDQIFNIPESLNDIETEINWLRKKQYTIDKNENCFVINPIERTN